MDHVLTIERQEDARAVQLVGICSCGWKHRDVAIMGYNDDSVRIGIGIRHSEHREKAPERQMLVVINTPASELNRPKRLQRQRLRMVRRLFRILRQVRP